MTDKKQPICRDCHKLFKSWNELAKHIVENQETHTRQSVVFAYHVLSEVDNVREFKPRMPMSDELRQAVKECVREISGKTELVRTVCPNCKKVTEQEIEEEHVHGAAWRNSHGTLVINCLNCRVILSRR